MNINDLDDSEMVRIGNVNVTYWERAWLKKPAWEIGFTGILGHHKLHDLTEWAKKLNNAGSECTQLQYAGRYIIIVENEESVAEAVLLFS